MKKNQNGITIVSLVITIIILIIIIGVTVNIGGNVIRQANLQTINTNMMLIQAKTKTIAEQSKFNNDNTNYKGTIVSEISDNNKVLKLVNDGIIDNPNDYYLLSSKDLEELGLTKIDIDDGYVVNYGTEEIIYVRGFKNNNDIYYKLSDLKTLKVE